MKDREAWPAAAHEFTNRHDFATEQQGLIDGELFNRYTVSVWGDGKVLEINGGNDGTTM